MKLPQEVETVSEGRENQIDKSGIYFSPSTNPKIEKNNPITTDNKDSSYIIAQSACMEMYDILNPNRIKAIPNTIFFIQFSSLTSDLLN